LAARDMARLGVSWLIWLSSSKLVEFKLLTCLYDYINTVNHLGLTDILHEHLPGYLMVCSCRVQPSHRNHLAPVALQKEMTRTNYACALACPTD
jgi:hypothetical protein